MGSNKKLFGYYPTTPEWLPVKVDSAGKVVISAIPAHKTSHQDGGSDEISVLGLSGLLVDAQTPLAHKTSHQKSGSDEISVTNLTGLLATAQTPVAHASSHAGGSDPLYYLPSDGWIPAGTFTYASATTITVASGAASIYQKGDKLKLTQTTVKYFYITTVADTLLTVTGGADYTVANAAITLPYYSPIENPLGFPHQFNYTPTGLTNTTLTGRFSLAGNIVRCTVKGTLTGTPVWTNMPTLPVTASANAVAADVENGQGGYFDSGTAYVFKSLAGMISASATKVTLYYSGGLVSATYPITWANNDQWWLNFTYEI